MRSAAAAWVPPHDHAWGRRADACQPDRTPAPWRRACRLFAFALPAQAEDWPARPVRMIVPYAPGGGTDVVARVLAQAMSTRLPHPVVVENRAGAPAAASVQRP